VRRFRIGGETLNRQTTLSCYRASDHPLSGVLCRAEMGSYKERANEEALQGHRRARQSETPKAPQKLKSREASDQRSAVLQVQLFKRTDTLGSPEN